MALLVANDHVFKGAGILHAVATGKLSDFSGMIVAPTLLAALLAVRTERGLAGCHVATGAVFAVIQLSPSFAALVEAAMAQLGVPWRLWPDATDLLALPALWLSWRMLGPAMQRPLQPRRRALELAQGTLATVGLLACVGTSSVREPAPEVPEPARPQQLVAAPAQPNVSLASLVGYRWQATNADGTWRLTYEFRSDGTYTATGHPAWHEAGVAKVVQANGQRLILRLEERSFDGGADDDVERELVFAPDGTSFTLNGDRYQRAERVASIALEDDATDTP